MEDAEMTKAKLEEMLDEIGQHGGYSPQEMTLIRDAVSGSWVSWCRKGSKGEDADRCLVEYDCEPDREREDWVCDTKTTSDS